MDTFTSSAVIVFDAIGLENEIFQNLIQRTNIINNNNHWLWTLFTKWIHFILTNRTMKPERRRKKKQFVKYLANVSYCFCTFFPCIPILCSSFIEIVLFCFVLRFILFLKQKIILNSFNCVYNFKAGTKLPQSHRKLGEEQKNNNNSRGK